MTPTRLSASPVLAAVLLWGWTASAPLPAAAQTADADADPVARAVAGLELREIGPALMGGRIADVEVSPEDPRTWFVAAGSGGVWKTTNAGVTWAPVFDDQPSYSIGEITLDPTDPDVVWVGTGENVSGRHVAWGDGVYRSRDAGATWERMGLEASEHVGRILVDPRDPDVVLVAAEGPLWSSGGERGVYRSADGGETWERVLHVDDDTGATDLEFDPTDPDVVYAATYERRRHTWGFLAGGPGSGIWKSTDNGATWREVTTGLPSGDVGKIGLAVTPADPARVYATIEAGADERGFYRSDDRGESWRRTNPYISGGTGPHYYQELTASPHDPDLVYQMDVFMHVTRDGGETFSILGTGREKHSDNHAFWIDPDDGEHLLAGTDAGLYESFDEGTTWRHFPNLPISQFYKVAVSSRSPFPDILGGAQDLGTLHGPVRTSVASGVRNEDWYVPLGADGYAVAFDPDDPDVMYMETQQGNLYRVHGDSDELLPIQPQPAPGDPPERFNWDAPLLVSPHDPARLYFGSQRLWRSDDRGDSWRPVSGDLTTDVNRYTLPYMDRVRSVNALFDMGAMSKYATITTISESPVAEGVLYVGTDDGLIQVSEDGGVTWRRAADLPGVPELSFINDVQASEHEASTVYAVADAHKLGDYSPYVFVSADRGRSWRSISGDLPDGTIVWDLEQDHEAAGLLFLGAEYGIHVSLDGGDTWHGLGANVPPIAFRQLALQRRDDDLVGSTFGRGFWILDDYGPLREIAAGAAEGDAALLAARDAWWYVPSEPMQAAGRPTLGTDAWAGPNPPFGAVLTYWLDDVPGTLRETRREEEDSLAGRGEDVPFPGWERLGEEAAEEAPRVLVRVSDATGEAVRWIEGPARPGLHRVAWDLRRPPPDAVELEEGGFTPPWASEPEGPLAPPGRYSARLHLLTEEGMTPLGEPRSFEVRPVPTVPPGTDVVAATAFQREAAGLMRRLDGAAGTLGEARESLRHMRAALLETPSADPALFARVDEMDERLAALRERLFGDPIRAGLGEVTVPAISGRASRAVWGHWDTRMEPTATMRRNLEIAEADFAAFAPDLSAFLDALDALGDDLEAAGAPYTPGRRPGGPR